ncbi:MAG: PspC domain-containing protein [Flavobacteriales bacterium]|nr:PspC domain-containing protein [Flavobacteriales bacterium]
MKKTLTANISGTVFHIEEDAYAKLQRYLDTVRAQFSGSDGRDEIMADIESRIAELFTERLVGRQVVTIDDVDHVIATMGQPEDYVGEDRDTAGQTEASGANPGTKNTAGQRRLMRDTEDSWVGGVLSGSAAYFGTEALWLRIAFIVFICLGWGTPIFLYLLLWILVPRATTPAEKLQMRGEPVTVENIRRVFEEGTERVKAGAEQVAREADELGKKWRGPEARSYANKAAYNAKGFANEAFGLIGKVIGIFMIMLGIVLGIALIGGLVGASTFSYHSLNGWNGTGFFELGELLFDSHWHAFAAGLVIVLLGLIPTIGLFMGGLRLLLNVGVPQWLGWTLSVIWIIALFMGLYIGLNLAKDFKSDQPLHTEIQLVQPLGQTLYLSSLEQEGEDGEWTVAFDKGYVEWDIENLVTTKDSVHLGYAELDVVPSPDSLYHLLMERNSQARSMKSSLARSGRITCNVQQTDSLLRFSPWVNFPRADKIRGQRVRFTVQVPVGRAIHFNPGIGPLLDDVDNVTNTWDDDMVGRTWTMTSGGLSGSVRPEQVPDDLAPPALAPAPEAPEATPTEKPEADARTTGADHAYSMPSLMTILLHKI